VVRLKAQPFVEHLPLHLQGKSRQEVSLSKYSSENSYHKASAKITIKNEKTIQKNQISQQ
jgi:hypothetical protein